MPTEPNDLVEKKATDRVSVRVGAASGLVTVACWTEVASSLGGDGTHLTKPFWATLGLSSAIFILATCYSWRILKKTFSTARNKNRDEIFSAITILAGLAAFVCVLMLVSSLNGSGPHLTEYFYLTLLLSSAIMLFAASRIWKLAKKFIFHVSVLLYGVMGAFFYLSVAITVFAILAGLDDQLSSFLTAPIGTKPDHTYYGFGSGWLSYLGAAVAFYLLFRFLRVVKNAIKRLTESTAMPQATAGAHPSPRPAG